MSGAPTAYAAFQQRRTHQYRLPEPHHGGEPNLRRVIFLPIEGIIIAVLGALMASRPPNGQAFLLSAGAHVALVNVSRETRLSSPAQRSSLPSRRRTRDPGDVVGTDTDDYRERVYRDNQRLVPVPVPGSNNGSSAVARSSPRHGLSQRVGVVRALVISSLQDAALHQTGKHKQ